MPAALAAKTAERRAGMRLPKAEPALPSGAGPDLGAAAGMPAFLQRKGNRGGKAHTTGIDSSDDEKEELLGVEALPKSIQAKAVIGAPDDPLEHEADRVAEAATKKDQVQRRAVTPSRRKPVETATLPGVDAGLSLADSVRQRVEPVLGADLGNVRVHTGVEAARAAQAIDARAFTHKNHIWLGPNESPDNTELIGHEATHVVQQSDSAGPGDTPDGAPAVQRRQVDSSPMSVEPPASAATPDMSLPGDAATPATPETMSSQPGEEPGASSPQESDSGAGGGGGGTVDGGADAGSGGAEGGTPGEAAGTQAVAGGGGEIGGHADGGGEVSAEEEIGGAPVTPPVPETGAGALETGDLVLIDVELAEHQRWAGALGRVGEVASLHRAEFIAESAGSGLISGAASGLAMGLGLGLVTRVVPAIGPVIGGGMALHGLITRDWAATGATIGRFGEGSDTYETLANSIASVAAVIDIVSQVLNVINGIVGVVQIAAAVIAGGAVVLAFFTFGATLGVAAVAGEVVATCEEISLAIGEVTMVLDTVNSAILQPCVTLFRALHAFTTQGDPREVEAQGHEISSAAAASGAALGAWAGGKAANAGRPRPPAEEPPPSQRPPHETPPPAAGDGPVVHFQDPVAPVHPEGTPAPAIAAPAAAPHEQLTLPGVEATPPGRPPSESPNIDPRQAEIMGEFAGAQQLASGAPLGQPELGNLPGPPGRHLRPGERDPGNYAVPPAARSRLARESRAAGMEDLGEAVASGTDTPRTAASRETLTSDRLLELTDPEVRASMDPEARADVDRSVEASHVPAVAQEPHAAHTGENVEIIDVAAHREGIHGGDVTRPLETGTPNPEYEGRPGFHPTPGRKPPSPQSDAGMLRAAEQDARALERNFPGASQAEIDAARQWLAAQRAQLRASGSRDFPRPSAAPGSNAADVPPGTQLPLPGMAHLAPRGPAPEQLTLPGIDQPGVDPNQLSLPFGAPPATTPTPAEPPLSSAAPTSVPPTTTPPTAPPTTTTGAPPATTSSTVSTWPAAAGAARTAVAQQAPGGPQPGTESSTWGTRAHQVGELFLPQVFGSGGEAPTYAQQQAAHRARFTADNQPAEGVERVSPNYPPPPATPAQINAIQDEIVNLLGARARAEQEAQHQSDRADRCEANQAPIEQSVQDTAAGISAVQAHDEAVARREAVNQEQQQRQQEAQGLVAGYPSRATGLAALSVPLAAWEGFTDLASHLPGEAGDKMLQMNREAQQMQQAFAQMGAEMLGVDSAGPAREAELHSDEGRLEATGERAQSSDGELHTASEGAAQLQDANETALAEAAQARDAHTDQAQQLGDAATQREEQADSLAEQLRAWASAHAQARRQAIAATEQRLQSEGRTVVRSSER